MNPATNKLFVMSVPDAGYQQVIGVPVQQQLPAVHYFRFPWSFDFTGQASMYHQLAHRQTYIVQQIADVRPGKQRGGTVQQAMPVLLTAAQAQTFGPQIGGGTKNLPRGSR